jgi:hypothetical protein
MSEAPRCDKCRHWGVDDDGYDWEAKAVGFHICKAVRERWEITDEASPKRAEEFQQVRQDALRASRAYVQDGSEYVAQLITGPNFFCALFAPSGAENAA